MPKHDGSGLAGHEDSSRSVSVGPVAAGATASESSTTQRSSPSEAFQALGAEPRVTVVSRLLTAPDGRLTFTELFESTSIPTTAGFAYHLRQLDGQYVRTVADESDDSVYELTDAGQRAARAIAAGVYTEQHAQDSRRLDDPCPYCRDEHGLRVRVEDNVTTIDCKACNRECLSFSLPPRGYATRDSKDVPSAVDSYHRRRIASFAGGICPDCASECTHHLQTREDGSDDERFDDRVSGGGRSDDAVNDDRSPADRSEPSTRVRLTCTCDTCGASVACPISLALIDHPVVVGAYHDRGVDVRARPLWRVLADWRVTVVSTDPWCIHVTMQPPRDPGRDSALEYTDEEADDDDDDDVLGAYVRGDLTVLDVDRLDAVTDVEGGDRITADVPEDAAADEGSGEDGTPA